MDTVTFKGNVMHLEGTQPAVGGKAPDFTLTANDMSPRSLKDYAGKVLVLVCVPSLDTPVCDMEVRRFNTCLGERQGAYCSREPRPALCAGPLVRRCWSNRC